MHPATFEKLVSRTLRAGVLISASFLVLGIIGFLLHPSGVPYTIPAQNLVDLFRAITTGTLSLSFPILLLYAGLVILALTPLARVLITLLGFAAQKDWPFVIFSFLVLLIITVSVFLGTS